MTFMRQKLAAHKENLERLERMREGYNPWTQGSIERRIRGLKMMIEALEEASKPIS